MKHERAFDGKPAVDPRTFRGMVAYSSGRMAEESVVRDYRHRGYEVVAQRWRGKGGEIDLIMARGKSIAFVEVKRRATLEAALAALTPQQTARLVAAAQQVVQGRKAFQALEIRLDLVALAPGRFPRHRRGVGA